MYKYIIVVFLVSLAACSSTTNDEKRKTNREYLMNENGWKLVGSVIIGPDGAKRDAYAALDACDKDDIEYYKEDSITVYDEGKLMCNPDNQQMFYDKYELKDDDSTLVIFFNDIDLKDTFYIRSIDEKSWVSVSYDYYEGETYTYIDSFVVNKTKK